MKLTTAQQARLDDLTARTASLTDVERAELSYLALLAAAAPAAEAEAEAESESPEPAAADADATPAPAAVGDAEPPAARPSIFSAALSKLKSRESLHAEISSLTGRLTAAEASVATLTAENATLAQRAAEGEAFAARVTELEAESVTVSQAAARIAASNHVAADVLPETSDDIETLDSVRSQLAAETDPRKRSALAKKARDLRNASLN